MYTSVQMGKSKQCVFMYNKSSDILGALFALYSIYFLTLALLQFSTHLEISNANYYYVPKQTPL